jgi:mono/diheme cytochrome c family protein
MKKFALLLALPLLAVACGGGDSTDATTVVDTAAIEAGKALFASNNCVTCHGDKGEGDGLAAAGLDPKPRKYSDGVWQDSVTDEAIKKVILLGGAANGLSLLMPANKQFEGRDADLDNIVAYIRSLKK